MKLLPIFVVLECSIWNAEGMHSDSPETVNQTERALFLNKGYPKSGDIPILNRKIFRGRRVTINEHPYIVSIRRMYAHYCTGAILSKNLVISVAHPFNKVQIDELGVVAGENYADRGTTKHTVLMLIIHEDFDPFTLRADLSLLIIYEKFRFTFSVKRISLITANAYINNSKAFVTGWGRCDFQDKDLCLPRSSIFFPDEILDPMLKTISFDFIEPYIYCDIYRKHDVFIKPGMMCSGPAREEDPTSPCLAAPGAPLVIKAKLAGILSWGFGCGYYYDMPLVYSDIQYYLVWLHHNINTIRNIEQIYWTKLFHLTKSNVLIQWLEKTRIIKPSTFQQKSMELVSTRLDEKLIKVMGNMYDMRDYLNGGIYHNVKKKVFEALKYNSERKEAKENY